MHHGYRQMGSPHSLLSFHGLHVCGGGNVDAPTFSLSPDLRCESWGQVVTLLSVMSAVSAVSAAVLRRELDGPGGEHSRATSTGHLDCRDWGGTMSFLSRERESAMLPTCAIQSN